MSKYYVIFSIIFYILGIVLLLLNSFDIAITHILFLFLGIIFIIIGGYFSVKDKINKASK